MGSNLGLFYVHDR